MAGELELFASQQNWRKQVVARFGGGLLATNATTGFFYVPTCAGPPTGTPAGTPTGFAPMIVDSTDNRLYFYSGGAWRNAGP